MKKEDIKAITLGGLIAAIYVTIELVSVYLLPILSIIGLFIMPLFAAYYASIYKFKYVIFFNIATILLSFICGISDISQPLLYTLPTLLIGDVYGLLNRLNIKYYTTIFLQAIADSIINLFTIYLGQIITETNIIAFLIPDPWTLENMSLVILFVLSGAQAIFSSMFTFEKLALAGIYKQKEKEYPIYGYFANIVFFILAFVFSFISLNFSFLFVTFAIVSELDLAIEIFSKVKRKELFASIICIIIFTISFILGICNLAKYIPILIIFPIAIISCVRLLKKGIK